MDKTMRRLSKPKGVEGLAAMQAATRRPRSTARMTLEPYYRSRLDSPAAAYIAELEARVTELERELKQVRDWQKSRER